VSENETESGVTAVKRGRKPRAETATETSTTTAEVRQPAPAPAPPKEPAAKPQPETAPSEPRRDDRAEDNDQSSGGSGQSDSDNASSNPQNADRANNERGQGDDDGGYRSRNQQRRDRFRDKRDRFRNREGGGGGNDDNADNGGQGGQGNQGGNEQRYERPQPQLPADFPTYSLNDLKRMPAHKLLEMAETLNLHEGVARMRKQDVTFALLKVLTRHPNGVAGDGVLEILPDGYGFLRSADASYLAGPDDVYISPSQIRRFNLRTGDEISGRIRSPKDGERYVALNIVDTINGEPPEASKGKVLF